MYRGTLQISLDTGFLLLQTKDDLVSLEFKGRGDSSTVKATFKVEDFIARIDAQQDPSELAMSV